MKLRTFIFGGVASIMVAGAITAAVEFSSMNKLNSPYLKILTKETYIKLKNSQNISDKNQALTIDYGSLPTSGTSFYDLLQQKKISGNAFILTVGSEAYTDTRKILYSENPGESQLNPNIDNSSLMLQLYDIFYNDKNERHNLVNEFSSINFYSFIDVIRDKEIIDASNLLNYRRTQLGDKSPDLLPDGTDPVVLGASKLWKVKVEKESVITEDKPVVMTSGGSSESIPFNYEPTDAYYQFLPNNKTETKYEKVYFRDQTKIKLFNSTLDWANNYASLYLSGVNLQKTGGIVCAKKISEGWVFSTFSSSSKLDDIIKFYNEKYDPDKPNGETTPEGETPPPSTY